MLTKLRIYNLAYAELLRQWEAEARRPNGPLKHNIMIRYDDEIEELHELILTEESKLQEHKTTEANYPYKERNGEDDEQHEKPQRCNT